MRPEDKKEFHKILVSTLEVWGRPIPSRDVISLWWSVFEPHSMEDVRAAFSRAVSESTGFLVPGQVRKYLPDRSGYLGPEEAWQQAPKSESEGAYVYQDMLIAIGACQEAIRNGDMIAARMGFIETYKKLIERAKKAGRTANWFWCGGVGLTREEADAQITQATLEAAEKRWITNDYAQQQLRIADQSSPNPKILDMLPGKYRRKKQIAGSKSADIQPVSLEKKI